MKYWSGEIALGKNDDACVQTTVDTWLLKRTKMQQTDQMGQNIQNIQN